MRIVFVDTLPKEQKGSYVDYNNRKLAGAGWAYCDLKGYFRKHQDKFLKDIEDWHIQLSQGVLKYTSWWWLLPASRLISWSPPVFNPLFFTVALIDYCESENPGCLYVRGGEKESYFYLKELKPQWEVRFLSNNLQVNFLNIILPDRFILWLKRIFSKVRVLSEFILGVAKSRGVSLDVGDIQTIVLSCIPDVKRYLEKGDNFFGQMFDGAKDRERLLWIYYGSVYHRRFLEDIRQEKNKKIISLYSFMSIPDLIRVIFISLRLFFSLSLYRNKVPPINVSGHCSKIFPKIFYAQIISWSFPVYELGAYFSMKRLLKRSQTKNLIYPYEEKGIERAVLLACKKFSPKTKTVGFAHAVYNPGFLYLRTRSNFLANPPKPDVFATPGRALTEWLRAWAKIAPEKMKIVGSPRHRFFYLEEERAKERRQLLKVLVVIGLGHEMIMLANWIEEHPDLFDWCETIIRPYPFGWEKEQKEGVERIIKINKNVKIESAPLLEQFKWADAVVYTSTSAGIEAMLSSRIAIYADLHDKFILDPLDGKGNVLNIFRCLNCGELKQLLERIRTMPPEEYLQVVRNHYDFAEQIYSELDYENLAV